MRSSQAFSSVTDLDQVTPVKSWAEADVAVVIMDNGRDGDSTGSWSILKRLAQAHDLYRSTTGSALSKDRGVLGEERGNRKCEDEAMRIAWGY